MTTKNTLVVVDATEQNHHLVQKAAASATGADSELVVLSVLSPADYAARRRAIDDTRGFDYRYTLEQAVQSSRNVALRIGNEALADSDTSFEAVGMVGRFRDAVLEAVETYDCDHIVVSGHRRRIRDRLSGVGALPTWLERSFPGHVSVYFDNAPDEPSIAPEADESIIPPKPA